MYFPKSQIKTNLYTRGDELQYIDSNRIYIGHYFSTSTGKYYTGKTPNDKPNTELIPISEDTMPSSNTPDPLLELRPEVYNLEDSGYYRAKGYLNTTQPLTPTPPIQYYPQPTPEEYNIGEFQRYFVKRTNEPKFIEVDKTQYGKYLSKDPQVAYQLYTPFSIPWEVSGDRNKVYNTNKNIVERTEKQQQLWGLKSYFKDRYTQFYK